MTDRAEPRATRTFDLSIEQQERAKRLHDETRIIDGLVAGTYYLDDPEYEDRIPTSGVTAGNLTVGGPDFDFAATVNGVIDARRRIRTSDRFRHVTSVDDISRVADSEHTGVVLGFQGANWVRDDVSRFEAMAELGVRVIGFTYNRGNSLGDGCCEYRDAGLTMLGREAVDECNDLGILLDVAHDNDATTTEVVDRSSDPVIASHIGCRALANSHARAKTDDQLHAIAENGGVNCITPFPPLIKQDPQTHRVQQADIDDVLNHIDHAVEVGGVESVAFGADLSERVLDNKSIRPGSNLNVWRKTHPEVYGAGPTDRMDPYPHGFSRYSELPNLTRGLLARGYDDDEIRKIMGENLLRVFETVWE